MGEVVSASCGRESEQNEAPRSKGVRAPSGNNFRAPQEGDRRFDSQRKKKHQPKKVSVKNWSG